LAAKPRGQHWKFLWLKANTAAVDLAAYYTNDLGRIVGILAAMLQGT
jgi:hypothetical protein